MATPEARFNIAASDQTRGAFRSAEGQIAGLNRGINRLKATVIGAVAGFVSFRGAVAAVEEFKKQEQATAKLNVTLVSMQRETAGLSKQLQGLAGQIQREGIIGDDAIVEGQAFLATFGKITDDMLPRTSRVMADLAARMGGDTSRAALTLGKASEGLTGELTRVGISLSDRAKESKDFQLILAEIEQQVGGTNRALAQTATGALQQFGNAVGDVQEVLGELVAVSISPLVQDMTNRMLGFTESVEGNRAAFESWARTAFNGLLSVAALVVEARARFEQIGLLWTVLKAGWFEFQIPVQEGLLAIGEAVNKLSSFIPGIGDGFIDVADDMARLEKSRAILDGLRDQLVSAGDVVTKSREDFRAWADQLTAAFDVALEKSRELREGISRGGVAPRAPTAEEPDDSSFGILGRDALDQMRDRLGERLGIIQESLLTENEALILHHEEQAEIINDAMNLQLVSRQEAVALLQELELQHQARMGSISAQGEIARRRFAEMNWKGQTKLVVGQLEQMTAGVAQHSRAMFEINKLAGIANAIINTAQGVTRALAAYPPPISFVMAALQAAAGFAQIQAIRSASFGGGGGAAPSLAGGTAAPPVTPVGAGGEVLGALPATAQQQVLRPTEVTINIQGVPSREQVIDITDQIKELLEDGGSLSPA